MNDEISRPRKIQSAVTAAAEIATIMRRVRNRRISVNYLAYSSKLHPCIDPQTNLWKPNHCASPHHSRALLLPAKGPEVCRQHDSSSCEPRSACVAPPPSSAGA